MGDKRITIRVSDEQYSKLEKMLKKRQLEYYYTRSFFNHHKITMSDCIKYLVFENSEMKAMFPYVRPKLDP